MLEALGAETTLSLATCAQQRVTIRPMSFVTQGLEVLFQTGAGMLKMRQIAENPQVALLVGTYEIEGIARVTGHPFDPLNDDFLGLYRQRHPGSLARYSALPDEVVVRVGIQRVRQWRYVNQEPMLAEAQLGQGGA